MESLNEAIKKDIPYHILDFISCVITNRSLIPTKLFPYFILSRFVALIFPFSLVNVPPTYKSLPAIVTAFITSPAFVKDWQNIFIGNILEN